MAMGLLKQLSVLGLAEESVAGTIETLNNTTVTTRTYDAALKINREKVARAQQGALGNTTAALSAASTALTFQTHLHGKGASGAVNHGILWKACGLKLTTATYSTASAQSDWKTLSAALWRDGRKIVGRGFMGNCKLTLEAGKPVVCDWEFTGGYSADPTAEATPTGTYESVSIPQWAGASAITLAGSTQYMVDKVEIDLGAEVSARHDANSAGGYHTGHIGNRIPKVRLSPDALAFGTKNWWTDFTAGTEVDMVLVVGSASNNTITITVNDMELEEPPHFDDERNGRIVDALGFDVHGAITIAYS